jgi:integrase
VALTFARIEAAKPQDKPYYLNDGDGLRLKVDTKGRKYFVGRKQINGKRRELHLGAFDPRPVTAGRMEKGIHLNVGEPINGPAQARRRYAEKIDQLESGIDPRQVKEEKQERPIFQVVAEKWIDRKSSGWEWQTRKRIEGRFDLWVYKKIGNKHIDEVTPRDIIDIVETIDNAGKTFTRGKILEHINNVFRFAKSNQWVSDNPADIDLDALGFQPHQGEQFKALDWDLRHRFWKDIENWQGSDAQSVSGGTRGLNELTKAAIKLQVLTLVRPSELRLAQWPEFDLTGKEHGFPVWTIPAERMKQRKKNGNDHLVPLSAQAVRILVELHKITGHLPQVFPGVRGKGNQLNPNGVMSDCTVVNACKRMGYQIHAHGFRHMASTALNEALRDEDADEEQRKWDADWIEQALSHVQKDKIRGTYNNAKYLRPRFKMLQWYADQFEPRPGGGSIKIEQLRRDRSLSLVA